MTALSLAAFAKLATVCAGLVAPQTMASVAMTESGLDPLAIGVNRGCAKPPRPPSMAAAAVLAQALVDRGCDPDLGIAQINVRAGHLQRRGLPLIAAFDQRVGLRVGCEVLQECFRGAPAVDEQVRLRQALGCYNTGRHDATAPYVARVQAAADVVVPAMRDAAPEQVQPRRIVAVRSVPTKRKEEK